MAYSPAFQFYYKDFREDPKTIRMDATEIGVYWLLIMECWDRDNKMPNDLEFLADIARMDVQEFEPIWKKRVAKCFVINEQKNTVSHKRIAKEILKQKNWKKKKSDAGKQGAAKRWNESTNDDGSAMAVLSSAMANDSSSSSSSFKEDIPKGIADKPPKPKKPSAADPRSKHPAIQVIRGLMKRYPDTLLWDNIIKRFGEDFDAEKLKQCRVEWVERGHNSQSTKWLNWYFDGIPQREFQTNGRKPAPALPDSKTIDRTIKIGARPPK